MIIQENILLCTNKAGIYAIYNNDNICMYVGKANNIRNRTRWHISNTKSNPLRDVKHNLIFCKYAILDCPVDRDIYETYYINLYQPKLNYEKVFVYQTERYTEKYNPIQAKKDAEWQLIYEEAIDDFYL